jgi:hypothetical protein
MKRENAPYAFLALEEKVTYKNAEEDDMQKLGLKEVLNPVQLENVDVLQREKQSGNKDASN